MTALKVLGLVSGSAMVAVYLYTLVNHVYGIGGSLAGMTVGLLFIIYGWKGTDLLEVLYEKLTGHRFSAGRHRS